MRKLFESILKEEIHKQFIQSGGKFTVPLDDMAAEVHAGNEMCHDFVTDDYDPYVIHEQGNRQWFEVVEIDGTSLRLIPVDKFGNKLTKAQIKKINPTWAERLEAKGYCKNVYIDDLILHVSVEEAEKNSTNGSNN